MRPAFPALAALISTLLSFPAVAGDGLRAGYTAFVHFGSSYVKQVDEATLSAAGAPIPGAAYTTEGDLTMSVEAGLMLRGGFAVAASGTIPTTISNIAGGTLYGLGNLGDESVGYYSATGQYHFNTRGPISPYIGTGVGYMHVFTTADGVVTDLAIASAWGPVIQAGIDFHLNERAGVFVDVKRYWISTEASGNLGGTDITADATVNPWVFTGGLGIRF